MCSGRGRWTIAPAAAATTAATLYWPSTPMLNRFIRKPTLTARPERNSGTDRLIHVRIWLDSARGVGPKSNSALSDFTGSTPSMARTMARTTSETRRATTAGTSPVTTPRRRRFMPGFPSGGCEVLVAAPPAGTPPSCPAAPVM